MLGNGKAPPSRTRRKWISGDLSGSISVEFALVLPLLLLAIFGTAATVDVLGAKRRVDLVGSSLGELTAGLPILVSNDDLVQISRAAQLILVPYPVNDLTLTLKSIKYDAAGTTACVDWSESWPRTGTGTPTAAGWETGDTTVPPNIPPGYPGPGAAVLMAEVRYTMTSPYAGILGGLYSSLKFSSRTFWTPEDLIALRRIVNVGDPPMASLCP